MQMNIRPTEAGSDAKCANVVLSRGNMIECKELAGKVVRSFVIYDTESESPALSITFEDGTNFSASLGIDSAIEAKLTLDEGGEPQLLKNYTP